MCRPLVMLYRKLLTSIEGSKRAMCKEYFLRDLRNTREKLKGKELKKVLCSCLSIWSIYLIGILFSLLWHNTLLLVNFDILYSEYKQT